MSPREHRDVHRHVDGIGLIQAHSEVSLSTQQQQDEDPDVHESDTCCSKDTQHERRFRVYIWLPLGALMEKRRLTLISPGVVQVIKYRNQNVQHVTALQDKEQELLQKKHKVDYVL